MKKSIGKFRLDFFSNNEVRITDSVPNPGNNTSENYSYAYPFLLAAKLLFNFPPPTGNVVVSDALDFFKQKWEDRKLEEKEVCLLGLCCREPIRIVDYRGKGTWVYESEFFVTDFGIDGFTKIANGDEDYFHRASIDACFEWFKNRWKEKFETDIGAASLIGISMCLFIQALFENYANPEKGIENIVQNYRIAVECAEAWTNYVARNSQ